MLHVCLYASFTISRSVILAPFQAKRHPGGSHLRTCKRMRKVSATMTSHAYQNDKAQEWKRSWRHHATHSTSADVHLPPMTYTHRQNMLTTSTSQHKQRYTHNMAAPPLPLTQWRHARAVFKPSRARSMNRHQWRQHLTSEASCVVIQTMTSLIRYWWRHTRFHQGRQQWAVRMRQLKQLQKNVLWRHPIELRHLQHRDCMWQRNHSWNQYHSRMSVTSHAMPDVIHHVTHHLIIVTILRTTVAQIPKKAIVYCKSLNFREWNRRLFNVCVYCVPDYWICKILSIILFWLQRYRSQICPPVKHLAKSNLDINKRNILVIGIVKINKVGISFPKHNKIY